MNLNSWRMWRLNHITISEHLDQPTRLCLFEKDLIKNFLFRFGKKMSACFCFYIIYVHAVMFLLRRYIIVYTDFFLLEFAYSSQWVEFIIYTRVNNQFSCVICLLSYHSYIFVHVYIFVVAWSFCSCFHMSVYSTYIVFTFRWILMQQMLLSLQQMLLSLVQLLFPCFPQ